MIDVEHRPLRAFEHHALAGADLLVEQTAPFVMRGGQDLAEAEIVVVQLLRIERFLAVDVAEHRFFSAHANSILRAQHFRIEQVGGADAVAADLRLVRGTDPAAGRADLRLACRFLAREVDRLVIREDARARNR